MSFLQKLRAASIERDKEWNPDKVLTISFRGNELAGEVGELCNQLKKYERVRLGLVGSAPISMNALAEELADVIICTDLIAMEFGIPLEPAIRHKFNKTSDERGLKVKL